jgi:hypothetical protein
MACIHPSGPWEAIMNTALMKQAEKAIEARSAEVKERRQKMRQLVARTSPGRSLVELALEASRPGVPESAREEHFLAALRHLEQELGLPAVELGEDSEGYYAFFVTPLPALLARRRASRIETQTGWNEHLSIECYGLAGSLVATGKVPRDTVGASALH